MKPPYDITPEVLKLVASIAEKLGHINAKFLDKPSPQLRKENRIQTIHHSLGIEGNSLSIEQITALLENKQVMGPEKDIKEVLNAIEVYNSLSSYKPFAMASFLKAHAVLMKNLVPDPGKFRTAGVGIVKGDQLTHMAPPASRVRDLMQDLFKYLKNEDELILVKSCVFHYELEFIHPFMDGNGRMGRLWQTLILMKEYPVFEFLPLENIIQQTQKKYYEALMKSDQAGNSTPFLLYMLKVIDTALSQRLDVKATILTAQNRLTYFKESHSGEFSRKDYMKRFQNLSTATASRDLKLGVELGIFTKTGDKKNTVYRLT